MGGINRANNEHAEQDDEHKDFPVFSRAGKMFVCETWPHSTHHLDKRDK